MGTICCMWLSPWHRASRTRFLCQPIFIVTAFKCAGADKGSAEPAELRALRGTKDPYQSGTAQRYHDLLHPTDRFPSRRLHHFNDQLPPTPRAWPTLPGRRMHGGKRGLVAPQNTFLENVVRRSSGKMIAFFRLQYLIKRKVSWCLKICFALFVCAQVCLLLEL